MDVVKLQNRANEIIDNLCKKYNIKRSDVILKTYTSLSKNHTQKGSANYLRNVVDYKVVYDKTKYQILLNDTIKTDKELLATTTHEFGHVLQLHHLGENKQKDLTKQTPKVKFTIYNKNLCEIQAEAFTIYEIGYSNNSVRGAKDMECYTKTIIEFFNQFKNNK